jgi:Ca2+-binding EF-hand superfamily protein
LAFTVGGVFAVESFAHAVIFTTFLANAFVFGFTDLTSFVDAVRALSRDETSRDKTFSIPGVSVARDAISALDATRRLASLRRCVDDAVAKTPETAEMTGVQRLGALLELSIAENARGFKPSAFALSESEAMRVASVFAEFDDDADGFVDAAELAALLRSAADSASVEVLDAMEWDPYNATFASDDAELDPGATAVAALDADGDGRVSLEEFVAWWRGGCPLESSGARAHAADDQDARTIATQSVFSAGD